MKIPHFPKEIFLGLLIYSMFFLVIYLTQTKYLHQKVIKLLNPRFICLQCKEPQWSKGYWDKVCNKCMDALKYEIRGELGLKRSIEEDGYMENNNELFDRIKERIE